MRVATALRAACRADEPVSPPQSLHVAGTRRVVGETAPELHLRARVVSFSYRGLLGGPVTRLVRHANILYQEELTDYPPLVKRRAPPIACGKKVACRALRAVALRESRRRSGPRPGGAAVRGAKQDAGIADYPAVQWIGEGHPNCVRVEAVDRLDIRVGTVQRPCRPVVAAIAGRHQSESPVAAERVLRDQQVAMRKVAEGHRHNRDVGAQTFDRGPCATPVAGPLDPHPVGVLSPLLGRLESDEADPRAHERDGRARPGRPAQGTLRCPGLAAVCAEGELVRGELQSLQQDGHRLATEDGQIRQSRLQPPGQGAREAGGLLPDPAAVGGAKDDPPPN